MNNNKVTTRQDGVSYVEVLVALLIFGVCLGPALNALSASVIAAPAVSDSSRALFCVKSQMEKVMAEPYSQLLKAAEAAGTLTTATTYSMAADSACPERRVYIARYDPTNASNAFVSTDTGLLFVKTTGADSATVLTSLIARP